MRYALRAAAIVPAILLAGCAGNPQRLPVGVSICSAVPAAHGFGIAATIENNATKPIASIVLSAAFYQNFRYRSYEASAKLARELDPGEKRDVTFAVSGQPAESVRGEAIRCYVTHLGYLDGTSDDAPRPQ